MKKAILALFGLFSVALYAKWSPNSCDPYGTHQPVLYAIASKTTGPIVEFGCGDGSTDLLHEICKKNNRILISIDDNREWLNKFRQKYLGDGYLEDNSDWHKFLFVPGKTDDSNPSHWIDFLDNCEPLKAINFDLCFIDQSPGLARTVTIIRFKDKARYIILHDCDMYVADKYEDFIPNKQAIGKQIKPLDSLKNISGVYDFSKTFRYFKVYFPPKPWPGHSGPPTLLGSNFESDFPDIDYENY